MGGACGLGAVALLPGVDADEVHGGGGETVAQVGGGGPVAASTRVGAVHDLADRCLDPGPWSVAFPPGVGVLFAAALLERGPLGGLA